MNSLKTEYDANIQQELLGFSTSHLHYLTPKIAIHKEMIHAYSLMVEEAKESDIDLTIASGFRSFERQLMLFNNKSTGKTSIKDESGSVIEASSLSVLDKLHAILLFSALPGSSRHHWGCDIDVYAPNLLAPDYNLKLEPWEYNEGGPLEKLSLWLDKHIEQFGFYRPYDKYRGGVAEEPWHLSYAPLAKKYQQSFSLESLTSCLVNSDIKDKQTILQHLPELIERYVLNVKPFEELSISNKDKTNG